MIHKVSISTRSWQRENRSQRPVLRRPTVRCACEKVIGIFSCHKLYFYCAAAYEGKEFNFPLVSHVGCSRPGEAGGGRTL